MSCVTLQGGLLEACTWFPLDFTPHLPFPFADFALYPSAVTNLICDCKRKKKSPFSLEV